MEKTYAELQLAHARYRDLVYSIPGPLEMGTIKYVGCIVKAIHISILIISPTALQELPVILLLNLNLIRSRKNYSG